jgi:KUP system potassium uptake protein
VTGTITINTLLFSYVVRRQWKKPLWLVLIGAAVFLSVELLFLAANLTKIAHGAWLPLLIALTVFTVLITWQRGRELVTKTRDSEEGPLREFVDELHDSEPPLRRVPGTAVFLNRGKATVPLAMRANVEHNHIRHDTVVILSIETLPVPHVPDEERITIDDLGHEDDGIIHVTAHLGYMQSPDVPAVLRLAAEQSPEVSALDLGDTSYFLSTIELKVGDAPGLAKWRKHLFVATSSISADAAEYFSLPRDRVVIMGSQISV